MAKTIQQMISDPDYQDKMERYGNAKGAIATAWTIASKQGGSPGEITANAKLFRLEIESQLNEAMKLLEDNNGQTTNT